MIRMKAVENVHNYFTKKHSPNLYILYFNLSSKENRMLFNGIVKLQELSPVHGKGFVF